MLDYLGRYTHRVAIANNRLVSVTDTEVRFRYQDYAHGNRRKVMTLDAQEFIRRFLLHVLPSGFMRIRHYGLLANRAKGVKLAAARAALDYQPPPHRPRPNLSRLSAACGGPGYPSVCVLQDRAHASGRPDQRAQGACATPTTMSAPIRPTRNVPKHQLPAGQRTGSSSVALLTQKCASVIVIASIEERPRAHDHAHAPLPYVDCRSWRRGSARRHPYNPHTTAP